MTISVFTTVSLNNKVKESTVVYKAQEKETEKDNDNNLEKSKLEENNNTKIESIKIETSLCLLGEIMLGGEVSNNLEYMYSQAFKNIFTLTQKADFTYANFSTNITNFNKIVDTKSKYLVTKDAVSSLCSLGIDSVSIASDHINDYPSEIIKNTVDTLNENNIFVAGRENLPVYFEKANKKVSIISTNSVILGTAKNYTDNGISIYTLENLKKNIIEAKQVADIVIVDVHWGKDHTYGVTNQMKTIACSAIDFGADLVVGSHALGVYPIVEYKSKPIIYSLGSLISDTDYNVGKEGFIFNININKENKISSLEMIPIFTVDKKEVSLYKDYDEKKCDTYLEQFNNWNIQNGLNSVINDKKIIINF